VINYMIQLLMLDNEASEHIEQVSFPLQNGGVPGENRGTNG